jgi:hypothetical protein
MYPYLCINLNCLLTQVQAKANEAFAHQLVAQLECGYD